MMLNERSGRTGASRLLPLAVGVGTLALMATAAFAARSAVQARVVTLAEGEALALRASEASEIPVAMNELVLRELNRFVGTPEGRRFVKNSLARMPQYRKMIEGKLGQYREPKELLAVPAIEGGYQNYFNPLFVGAGLWGFVKQTARRYHLVVDGEVDERLDEEKETDAAMRCFRDLFARFHDWRLALKGYNEGEVRVQELIDKLGTSDPWEIEKAAESKEHYLAKVTALIILMKNPSLLD